LQEPVGHELEKPWFSKGKFVSSQKTATFKNLNTNQSKAKVIKKNRALMARLYNLARVVLQFTS
jgi:hypothetical protein